MQRQQASLFPTHLLRSKAKTDESKKENMDALVKKPFGDRAVFYFDLEDSGSVAKLSRYLQIVGGVKRTLI